MQSFFERNAKAQRHKESTHHSLRFSVFAFNLIVLFIFSSCLTTQNSQSGRQDDETQIYYEDYVYNDSIRSVQLYRGLNETAYPIHYLGESLPLTLEFDELISHDRPDSRFWVDILPCDWNWKPSLVLPTEFYQGYIRREITLFRRSEFSKVTYTHFAYQFPQEEEAFLQSGNYLLRVFRNGDENDLVFTRRFVVADRKAVIANNYMLDPNLERNLLSQLRFDVSVGNLDLFSPTQDLMVKVLQNFRWDNAFHVLRPRFVREERFEYMVDLDLAFKGGGRVSAPGPAFDPFVWPHDRTHGGTGSLLCRLEPSGSGQAFQLSDSVPRPQWQLLHPGQRMGRA
jgi:hypothetical protein